MDWIWRAITELEIALVETSSLLGTKDLMWPAMFAGVRRDPSTGQASIVSVPSLNLGDVTSSLSVLKKQYVEPRAACIGVGSRSGRPRSPRIRALFRVLSNVYASVNREPPENEREAEEARREVVRLLRTVCGFAGLHVPKNLTYLLSK